MINYEGYKMEYSLDKLLFFKDVVELGNFSNASKFFNVSDTTVARRVIQLEEDIGAPLLIVNSKCFVLTKVGEQIYHLIKNNTNFINKLTSDITDVVINKKNNSTILKIIVPGTLGYLMVGFFKDFIMKNKNIGLQVFYQNTSKVDLVRDGIDLAIINYVPDQQNQKFKKIFSTSGGIYCTQEYADKYGVPLIPEELANHLVVGQLFDNYSFNSTLVNQKTGKSYDFNYTDFRFMSNSGTHNLELLKSNEFICGFFDYAKFDSVSSRVLRVLPDYHSVFDYYLIKHSHNNSKEVNLLSKCLSDYFANLQIDLA